MSSRQPGDASFSAVALSPLFKHPNDCGAGNDGMDLSTLDLSESSGGKNGSVSDVLVRGGESSVYGASFNFINSIVGAGIIGIPYALKLCGFYTGIIMLILVAFLVNQSVIMLIECGLKCKSSWST